MSAITVSGRGRQPDLANGTIVRLAGFGPADRVASFDGYGDPRHACPETHVSTPGMRIAYVRHPRYGRIPIWEADLAPLEHGPGQR